MRWIPWAGLLTGCLLMVSGCEKQDSAEWNAYFSLFQEGRKVQGTLTHVTPSQMGDVLLHIQYTDPFSGEAAAFIETWPAPSAESFKPGMTVDVYLLPGGAISRATGLKLKNKKIM